MKKILLTALVGSLTVAAFAQGTVAFGPNNSVTTPFQTNGLGIGLASGNIGNSTSQSYDLELLTAASTDAIPLGFSGGALTGGWSDTGASGTGAATKTGGVTGGGAVSFWAPGSQQLFQLVAWSANLGTWAQVQADLSGATFTGSNWFGGGFLSATWTGNAFVGLSAVGNLPAGGGTASLPVYNLFGTATGTAGTPIITATELYGVMQVPEPTTFALMGLGASALMIFRRRK